MDGGTCEATVAVALGYHAIGISIPLGKYHNQSFEGGPDSRGPKGPAPEFVHEDDIEGMMRLCEALMTPKLPWADPWGKKLKDLRRNLKKFSSLLKSR